MRLFFLFEMHFSLYFSSPAHRSCELNWIPFVRVLPCEIKVVIKLILFIIVCKGAFAFGYFFMDELSKAVEQFYPSASGGMSGGFNSPPPSPSQTSMILTAPNQEPREQEFPADAAYDSISGYREAMSEDERSHYRNLMQSPEYRSTERSLERATEKAQQICEQMELHINAQGVHIEDREDIRRGVNVYLMDFMEKEPRARLNALNRILRSLRNGENNFYNKILNEILK